MGDGDSVLGAWIDGEHLAVARSAKLPGVCIKCASSRGVAHRERTVVALPDIEQRRLPLDIAILSVFGMMPARGAKAVLALPMCSACVAREHVVRAFGIGTIVGVGAAFGWAWTRLANTNLNASPVIPGLTVIGALLALVVVARVVAPRLVVHAVHVTLEHVVLAGVPARARKKIVARLRAGREGAVVRDGVRGGRG
jgi:hypothetical protein